MEANKHTAVAKFTEKGYNCCQAVACTYCEKFGIKEEDMFRMTEGFGLGMPYGYLRRSYGHVPYDQSRQQRGRYGSAASYEDGYLCEIP